MENTAKKTRTKRRRNKKNHMKQKRRTPPYWQEGGNKEWYKEYWGKYPKQDEFLNKKTRLKTL